MDDGHRAVWLRNSRAHLINCDNCPATIGDGVAQMCDHHAKLSQRAAPCAGCGLQVLFDDQEAFNAAADAGDILCPQCEVDPPQCYADWKGHEAGKKLAADVLGVVNSPVVLTTHERTVLLRGAVNAFQVNSGAGR